MKRYSILLAVVFSLVNLCGIAQLKVGDQPTQSRKAEALDVQGANGLQGIWLPRVSDTSSLGIGALNPPDGLVIYYSPTGKLLLRSNNSWLTYNTSAITTIAAGGQSVAGPGVTYETGTAAGATNDFNIAANSAANTVTYNMPDASTAARGVGTTGGQTFGGDKRFNDSLVVNCSSTLNGGTIANGGLTVLSATGAISNLTLGITSSTTPEAATDKYLSVNSSGNVTLNSFRKIRTYYHPLDGLPRSLGSGSSERFTFTISGANLSTSSTVTVSPTSTLNNGTSIDWARVLNATTIELIFSTKGSSQNFSLSSNGYYNITVIEF